MRAYVAALMLAALLPVLATCLPQEVVIVEYGMETCPHCSEQKEVLGGLGVPFVYVELLGNETNVMEYLALYDSLIGGERYVPLIVIVINGVVKAAVVGGGDASYWEGVNERAAQVEGVLVVDSEGRERVVTNETVIQAAQRVVEARLRGLAPSPGTGPKPLTLREVLPILVSTAAADSVNPCTFSVFTALLLITLSLTGRGRALASSLAFIAAVYACYYLLGLGLTVAIVALPPIFVKVIAAAGLVVGAYSVASSLRGEFRSPVPSGLKRVTEEALYKVAGPLSAAGLGALCSFTLLPCSSGPYVVFTATLSRLPEPGLRYLLLGLYNAIFVAPLVAIAVAVTLLGLAARRVKKWRSGRSLALMELVGGILLVAVCAYILLT
ncbi:MAG: hypothetical protein J7L75_02935 [Thermoproteales archaeon]|nr:hypothetical protein [Thermoproteales archaeon]